MPKKNIVYKISSFAEGKTLTSETGTIPAIFEDNCIKYIIAGTKNIYNLEKNSLTRENSTLKIVLQFIKDKKTEALVTAKDINKTVFMKLKTKELFQDKNNLIVEYELESVVYKFSIEVKEWVFIMN